MIRITKAHGSEAEKRTVEQLQALLVRFNLQPWEFTDTVVVDELAIPHSHPVLTLHTRHWDDDGLLLATYLHEQLHWFIWQQPDERIESAIEALTARYPEVPVGFPVGAEDALSSYVHYLICYLEYLSLRSVVGDRAARRVFDVWQADHYTEIYRTVMQDMDAIAAITRTHDLLPPQLRQQG